MTAAFPHRLSQFFLGMAKTINQLPIPHRLFDWIEISALNILDNRNLENLNICEIPNNDGQFMQLRHLRGAPTAFASNNLIITIMVWIGAHDKGLNNALFFNRCGKLLQCFWDEITARLFRIGANTLNRQFGIRTARRGGLRSLDILRWRG